MNRELLKRFVRNCTAVLAVVLTVIALTVDRSVKCATEHREVAFIDSKVLRTELIVDRLPWHADVVYLP